MPSRTQGKGSDGCWVTRIRTGHDGRKEREAAVDLPPPPFFSIHIMEKAFAYEAQGGVPAQMRRVLAGIADGDTGASIPASSATLWPGARPVRKWHRRTDQVAVLDKGVRMDGGSRPLLSALDCHIAGTSCSGHCFSGSRTGGSFRHEKIRCALYTRKKSDHDGLE